MLTLTAATPTTPTATAAATAATTPTRRPELASSVALITGGGRGIGRLVADALAASGAAVGLVARSGDELTAAVDAITAHGGTAAAAIADVTHPAELAAAVTEIQRQLGPIDLLLNNAGISGPIGPLWEVDADAWWATMDVNLRGILLCTQLVLPTMVALGRGRIINVTSQAGVHRWPLVSAYSVSKAAVTKLTENLAQETARHGVSVFSVHPGLLPIGMAELVTGAEPTTPAQDLVRRWTMRELAEGRGADPAQAVELIVRLAAGDGDRLSGLHLSVHDDLDTVLSRLAEVRDQDLYLLRPRRLAAPARGGADAPASPRRPWRRPR